MNVPLLDLKAQYAAIKSELDAALAEVIESQYFIMGPKVEACEKAVAEYCGCVHGIGVSSGTDALLVSLMAIGIEPGDEVITSPYTFFATAGSIARLGAKPVFVDIDPVSYNINTEQIEQKITKNTRAIIPVHLYGQMADMDPIMEMAKKHDLYVIEDAAQAIGAEYKGRRAGSVGDLGSFSFFPSKNLGAFGDGGMVTGNDAELADKVKLLRNHGYRPKYYNKVVGGNFRLDALQAAVVAVKLKYLDQWTAARQSNAKRYDRLFEEAGLAGAGASSIPHPASRIAVPRVVQSRHIFNQYVIRLPNRDEVKQHLKDAGIGTEVYYPVPLHLQECFADLGYKEGDCPESERAANETMALPVYPEVTDEQARFVVEKVAEAVQ